MEPSLYPELEHACACGCGGRPANRYARYIRGHRPLPEPAIRFWRKVDKSGDCWLWTAATSGSGYGTFVVAGRFLRAHRFAYELLVGPIPDGLQLDHLCRNPACVNPEHLEPVTQAENIRRGEAGRHWATKTHCPKGHPYDEQNTYVYEGRGGRRRGCRACDSARSRKPRGQAS